MKTHEWLIDFDLKVWQGEEYFILRPDIAGKNMATGEIDFCVEIADSTLSHDTGAKKELFASAGIEKYVVISCKDYTLHFWELDGRSFKKCEQDTLQGLADEIQSVKPKD
ncbi:MAG: Uma2 family endonuclease [Pseudobdellovibrionaceae bacterium]|nr:Uma2 family endonuclease [Pseudobdellovibrionaceae bacterium]